jgi:hypothetical protein
MTWNADRTPTFLSDDLRKCLQRLGIEQLSQPQKHYLGSDEIYHNIYYAKIMGLYRGGYIPDRCSAMGHCRPGLGSFALSETHHSRMSGYIDLTTVAVVT